MDSRIIIQNMECSNAQYMNTPFSAYAKFSGKLILFITDTQVIEQLKFQNSKKPWCLPGNLNTEAFGKFQTSHPLVTALHRYGWFMRNISLAKIILLSPNYIKCFNSFMEGSPYIQKPYHWLGPPSWKS